MKIPNERQLQQITIDYSLDIDYKDFISPHKKCTAKPYSFLVIDTTVALDNPLRLSHNIQKEYKN